MIIHGPIYQMVESMAKQKTMGDDLSVGRVLGFEELLPKIQEIEQVWIPVSETYPTQDKPVILSDGKVILRGVYLEEYKSFGYYKGGESEDDWEFIRFGNKITHWMELPLPPK